MPSIEFEVFGKVQKVFFRKFTKIEAEKLGISGWCENTETGSVRGVIQSGNLKSLNDMKRWLSTVGSPKCQIEKSTFKEVVTPSENYTFFEIRKFPVLNFRKKWQGRRQKK